MSSSASRLLSFPHKRRPFVRPPRTHRRVVQNIPHSEQLCDGYSVTWWTQQLSCGHNVTAFTSEQRYAKRRQCPECSHALQLANRAPVVKISSAVCAKQLLAIVVLAVIIITNCACAGLRTNIRHHPALYGAAAGTVIGLVIVRATMHNCASTYDGKPYDGTPPCPKPDHTPTGRR